MAEPMVHQTISLIAEARNLTTGAVEAYTSTLRRFSEHMGGAEYAIGTTTEQALEWIEHIRNTKSESNAYYEARRGSAIFNALVDLNIVESNPFTYVLAATEHYRRKPLYEDPVTLPEIKSIIEFAQKAALGDQSTTAQIQSGVVALLHVKYCIPYPSIAALRMKDYVKSPAGSVLIWKKTKPSETCYVDLDKDTIRCLDRHISYRGRVSGEDPLFAQPRGKNKGGFYNGNNMKCITSRLFKEAGVSVGNRNLKVAAARLAAEAGANTAEIRGITSSISTNLAYTIAKEQAQIPAMELWDRFEMEIQRKAPVARGSISASALREVLDKAEGLETVDFMVTATGKLQLSIPE